MSYDYDLFVIGAGSGGVRAARIAAMSGARTAIAEEHRVGGTCVIRGCVPKKLLVYGSEFRQAFEDARRFGWSAEGVRFDWATLRDNVAAEVDRLSGIYARNLKNAGVELLHERAELAGPHEVRLVRSGRVVTAERILIAVGGRPYRPLDLPGQEHAITSNEAFLLPSLPRRVIVAGGGYIAAEFATIFHGLGVETCLLYRGDTILKGFDADVRTHVHGELARAGVRIITGAVFSAIEKQGESYRCALSNGMTVETDLVMFAIGRDPATEGLGLEAAGVETDARGAIKVDAQSRSSVPSIFAVGDVTNRVNLTPIAIREGHAFADAAFNGRATSVDYDVVPTAVFCRPPVGAVGLTEAEARQRLGRVDIYRTTFRPIKHTLAHNEERTFMKLVVCAQSGRVVGAHMAGADAPEIIQMAAIAVKAGLTKAQWDETVALHPTAAEEFVLLRERYVPQELAAAE